jgi:cardiolipin synthase
MKINAAIVRYCAGYLVLGLVAGCATSGSRSHYLQQIAPASVTNLTAYCAGNSLEIIYPLGGKAALAHVTWHPTSSNDADYQYQFAVLTFAKEKRTARKAVLHPGNRLVIRDASQWQHLLHEVFAGLAPDQPGHGILLLVQYLEIVVYRDPTGQVKVVKLETMPPGITVDKTFSDADFSREAIRQLESHVTELDRNQSQFLFLTGESPSFVLVDLHERRLLFLSYPADPEAEPVAVPGWFTLRALNSLLIRSLAITAVKNPFTLVGRSLWHLGNSGMTIVDEGAVDAVRTPPPLYPGPGMNLADWEKELDGLISAKRYQGRAQLLIDGSQFFPALIQSIENARQSVDVMVYIFTTDYFSVRIADVLKERSASVRVRVLMDDLGSMFAGEALPRSAAPPDFPRPTDIKSYLETGSHVQVRATTNPWLTTDHRKCIIIDDRQAFVGGMNIGSVYRYEWHDLMLGLTGPIVGRLDKDYRKAWAFAGPLGDFAYAWASLFDREQLRRNVIADGIDIRPLRTATGKMQIYRAQLAAIRRAQSYIYIENAYFNDDTILRELILARQRGVDVRVILPAENDIGIMQISNLVMANELIRNGIRVYAYPGMTHVKAAIYDGWACVGSANLEKMSLRVSQELDVAFSDPATVARLKQQLFDADFNRSRELKNPVASNWLDSLVKIFADQL